MRGALLLALPLLLRVRALTSVSWVAHSYEFVDCGGNQRLERFGDVLVRRPCPSAVNAKAPGCRELWAAPHLVYEAGARSLPGTWTWTGAASPSPQPWHVCFGERQRLLLDTSSQGQLGVFPEQRRSWEWIAQVLARHRATTNAGDANTTVLNGFAYTGGASLAALSVQGVSVTHLDASRTFNGIASSNVALSHGGAQATDGRLRLVADDCMSFLERELRRGNTYDMLVFDPPAFGRAKGRVWKLDADLTRLAHTFPRLLSARPCAVLLSCHDAAWPHQRLGELLASAMRGRAGSVETGALSLTPAPSAPGSALAMGAFARWTPSS